MKRRTFLERVGVLIGAFLLPLSLFKKNNKKDEINYGVDFGKNDKTILVKIKMKKGIRYYVGYSELPISEYQQIGGQSWVQKP